MSNEVPSRPANQIEQLGPYKIFEPLGRGGMGTVYRALDTDTQRHAAVKVLSPVFAQDEGFRDRFEAEVKSLEQLRHPRIVQLYGYGEQDGHLFYAMELMSGRSLQDELAAGRRFSWREALPIIVDLCGALKHAHDHGVIHRDIKPANLLLIEPESDLAEGTDSSDHGEKIEVKLADFGIAKLFGNTSLTIDGGVLGTADYMSPEQAEGEPVTPRSDLYSLGCVLYALLAGQPPFRGKSIPEVIHKVRFDQPKPIGRLVDDVPKELEHILNQLLAKSPEDRVPTALALSNRLQSLQHGLTMKIDRALTGDDEKQAPSTRQNELYVQDTVAAGSDNVASDEAVVVSQPAQNHFVAVEDDRGSSEQPRTDEESPAWRAVTIVALLVPLILMVWGVYRLVAPPSADELYGRVGEAVQRIEDLYAGADEGPQPDALARRADVNAFLRRFPEEPRGEQMSEWKQKLEAILLEQRVERNMRIGWDSADVTPMEDLVLTAMRLEATEPGKALDRYQELIDLFPADAEQDNDAKMMVLAVEGRMTKLKRQMMKTADLHVALIRNRLAKARALAESDPEQAKQIIKAVIKIYSDAPWAKKPVRVARQMLAQLP